MCSPLDLSQVITLKLAADAIQEKLRGLPLAGRAFVGCMEILLGACPKFAVGNPRAGPTPNSIGKLHTQDSYIGRYNLDIKARFYKDRL